MARINGRGIADVLRGGSADDVIFGFAGADALFGEGGHDTLVGGAGADTLNGGVGFDIASYADSTGGVVVDLSVGRGERAFAQGDVLTGVRGVIGSRFGDLLIGTNALDRLEGGAGDDTLIGLGAGDALFGGAGRDTVSYFNSGAAVTVRLWLTTAQFGFGHAAGDVIRDVENVVGSRFADDGFGGTDDNLLRGLVGGDTINGGRGNDTIEGGAGADSLIGGDGVDTVDYSGSAGGVFVRLWAGDAGWNDGAGDRLSGFEIVLGSAHGDRIHGSRGATDDTLIGGAGNDSISGFGGADRIQGDAGRDFLFGNDGDDTIFGGRDSDTVIGGAGNDFLTGDLGDDTVRGEGGADDLRGGDGRDLVDGDAGDDTLRGGDGDDTLRGGAGRDLIFGGAGGDEIRGGADDDVLGGSDGDDLLFGDGGDDLLFGDDGADSLLGGDGDDTLLGGDGVDTLTGGAGRDVFVVRAGADAADVITDFDPDEDDMMDLSELFAGQPIFGQDFTMALQGGVMTVSARINGVMRTVLTMQDMQDAPVTLMFPFHVIVDGETFTRPDERNEGGGTNEWGNNDGGLVMVVDEDTAAGGLFEAYVLLEARHDEGGFSDIQRSVQVISARFADWSAEVEDALSPALSGDGRVLAFTKTDVDDFDDDGDVDEGLLWRRDLTTGAERVITDGVDPGFVTTEEFFDGFEFGHTMTMRSPDLAALSQDGRYLAVLTGAAHDDADTDGAVDLYLYDAQQERFLWLSRGVADTPVAVDGLTVADGVATVDLAAGEADGGDAFDYLAIADVATWTAGAPTRGAATFDRDPTFSRDVVANIPQPPDDEGAADNRDDASTIAPGLHDGALGRSELGFQDVYRLDVGIGRASVSVSEIFVPRRSTGLDPSVSVQAVDGDGDVATVSNPADFETRPGFEYFATVSPNDDAGEYRLSFDFTPDPGFAGVGGETLTVDVPANGEVFVPLPRFDGLAFLSVEGADSGGGTLPDPVARVKRFDSDIPLRFFDDTGFEDDAYGVFAQGDRDLYLEIGNGLSGTGGTATVRYGAAPAPADGAVVIPFDDIDTPALIGPGVEGERTRFRLQADDEDWFAFVAPAQRMLELSVTPAAGVAAPLGAGLVTLRDADGDPLESRAIGDDPFRFIGGAERYYVSVSSDGGAGGAYDIAADFALPATDEVWIA